MSTPIKRKLAAILSADVAGYSRLMGADEEGTMRLLAAHRAIVDSIIDLHDGRVVNTAGDSVLAEFTSPVEAVRAASEIQDALRTRNESLPGASRMQFRIGVHLGDVMIKGDDLLGDGVNVAARLQAIAEPGGICISGSIFDQIEGKLSLRFQDVGEQSLKNIARPVRALMLRGSASTLAPPPAPTRPRRRTGPLIAVGGAALLVIAAGAYFLHAREAEIARVRAEAEAVRVKAEAETARIKAEAEVARAKAEAEAARVKKEADAANARADAERKKAAEQRPTAPQAPAPQVVAPQPAVLQPPVVRETRFDGIWVGEMTCPNVRDATVVQRPQRVLVQNGEMVLEFGPPGRARSIRSVGKVQADDSIELRGSGTGPGGRPFEHVVKGRFTGETFTGQAQPPARPCTLQLARAPARLAR